MLCTAPPRCDTRERAERMWGSIKAAREGEEAAADESLKVEGRMARPAER